MSVWLILIPAFLLVGCWLIVYNKKRGTLMQKFAAEKCFPIQQRGHSALEDELDNRFVLPSPYARGFSLLRDVITLPVGKLFRVTELLDLSRYGIAQNTHAGRIALYMPYLSENDWFLIVGKQGELRQIIPEYPLPADNNAALKAIRQFTLENPTKNELVLTIKDGFILIYPTLSQTGSETLSDLEYLTKMAESISH